MRFNKTFCLKICPILENSNNITHSQLPTHYSIYGSFHLRIMSLLFVNQWKLRNHIRHHPHITLVVICLHICAFMEIFTYAPSRQPIRIEGSHRLPHLTRVVDIHLHIFTCMDLFTHALRHFKSSSNQRTRWY